MYKSESIVNISKSLLAAQRKTGAASKEAKNPFFKSKFADYGSVLEAVKAPLNDEGISILQPTVFHDGKTFVETTLLHESGEWISSMTDVVCAKQNDPQAMGAAITYSRRYGLQSLLSLPAEDDDGESAMLRDSKPKTMSAAKETTVVLTSSEEPKANPWRKPKPVEAPKVGGMEF